MTKAEFLTECLTPICEQLGEAGANHMGVLTRAQAALFHNATQMLADLEEMITEELCDDAPNEEPTCGHIGCGPVCKEH